VISIGVCTVALEAASRDSAADRSSSREDEFAPRQMDETRIATIVYNAVGVLVAR
jgi:hypothetical protein